MAAHGIVAGKPYYLVYDNRGVGIEVETNWDWVRLSNKQDGPWHTVTFHEYEGGRYVIEHETGHWDDYKYWQLSSQGVSLNKWDPSTAWTIHPTKNGFLLGKGDNVLVVVKDGKKWLKAKESGLALGFSLSQLDPVHHVREMSMSTSVVEFQAVPA